METSGRNTAVVAEHVTQAQVEADPPEVPVIDPPNEPEPIGEQGNPPESAAGPDQAPVAVPPGMDPSIFLMAQVQEKLRHMTVKQMREFLGCLEDNSEQEAEQEKKRHFDPAKASAALTRVAEWLAARTINEKLAAIVMNRLQDSELQDEVKDSGHYDGDIGGDLEQTWLVDLGEAELDDEQLYVYEMIGMIYRFTSR